LTLRYLCFCFFFSLVFTFVLFLRDSDLRATPMLLRPSEISLHFGIHLLPLDRFRDFPALPGHCRHGDYQSRICFFLFAFLISTSFLEFAVPRVPYSLAASHSLISVSFLHPPDPSFALSHATRPHWPEYPCICIDVVTASSLLIQSPILCVFQVAGSIFCPFPLTSLTLLFFPPLYEIVSICESCL